MVFGGCDTHSITHQLYWGQYSTGRSAQEVNCMSQQGITDVHQGLVDGQGMGKVLLRSTLQVLWYGQMR